MQPFIGSAAVRRGELSRRGLAREHVAIYRDVYLHRDVELTALVRARAAWLATGATLVGVSAAAVHGIKWLDGSPPVDIGRTHAAVHAIPILDALFNARGLKHGEVSAVADAHPGVRGVASLRAMLPNVDGGGQAAPKNTERVGLVTA